MQRIAAILSLVVVLSGLAAHVEAGGWGRGRLFAPRHVYRPPAPQYHYTPPLGYYHYPTPTELYPKYYGSFHYRHLDNIGIPSGDIGLRGNGLYMSPW